jgi:hypothetical protein
MAYKHIQICQCCEYRKVVLMFVGLPREQRIEPEFLTQIFLDFFTYPDSHSKKPGSGSALCKSQDQDQDPSKTLNAHVNQCRNQQIHLTVS